MSKISYLSSQEFGRNGTEQTRTENLVTTERLMRAVHRQQEISKKGEGQLRQRETDGVKFMKLISGPGS